MKGTLQKLIVYSVALGMVAGGLHSATRPALARELDTNAVKTLTRDLEPIIVTGQQVGSLLDAPVGDLFVYALHGSTWEQIPFQIDEVSNGQFVASGDGLLSPADEIVFMAKDAGDEAPAGTNLTNELAIDDGWYVIEASDSTSAGKKAWAYVVRSPTLDQTFSADYVSFNGGTHRITGENYTLGYNTPNPWADYLTLGSSSTDILDRNKFRACNTAGTLCLVTEETAEGNVQDDPIKDGPVRAIIRSGRVLGYGSMLEWSTSINLTQIPDFPLFLGKNVRVSLDWSPAATGAQLYNANLASGVVVDGAPDAVSTALSDWTQLSTNDGSLVQVSDLANINGTKSNFYEDDSTNKVLDTGDKLRYGEAGVFIVGADDVLEYDFALYLLPGKQDNVGQTYNSYYDNRIAVSAVEQHGSIGGNVAVNLPFISRQ